MIPRHLIAADLDGTLYRNDGRASRRTLSVLRSLRSEGHVVVLATARSRARVVCPERHEISAHCSFLVASGGACVVDCVAYRVLFRSTLDVAVGSTALASLAGTDRSTLWLVDDRYYVSATAARNYPEKFAGHSDAWVLVEDQHLPPAKAVQTIRILGLEDDAVRRLEQALSGRAELLDLYWGGIRDTTVAPLGATKGSALQRIAALSGIDDRANIVAIGDGLNDLSMFSVAGLSVAVSNGVAEVQQAADVVVPSNELDGPADWLSGRFGLAL